MNSEVEKRLNQLEQRLYHLQRVAKVHEEKACKLTLALADLEQEIIKIQSANDSAWETYHEEYKNDEAIGY